MHNEADFFWEVSMKDSYSFISLWFCIISSPFLASVERVFAKLHHINIKVYTNFSRNPLPSLQPSCWDRSSLAFLAPLPWLINGSAIFLLILSQLYLPAKSHRFNIQRRNYNHLFRHLNQFFPDGLRTPNTHATLYLSSKSKVLKPILNSF